MKKFHWVGFLPFYLLITILCVGIAAGSSEAVSAAKQKQPVQRNASIVIDAGHGGIDGGATSCTGVLESKLNLDIALRLEALLQLLGVDTIMIRRTDTSVYTDGNTIASQKISDLKERVRIVRETENAVLVSIHQNTFSDARYSGAQVFHCANGASKLFAQQLQSALVSSINVGSNRKCKEANGIYLLQNVDCVGALIECGFLSNPQEEAKLRSEEYQKQFCCVVASCIQCYINSG